MPKLSVYGVLVLILGLIPASAQAGVSIVPEPKFLELLDEDGLANVACAVETTGKDLSPQAAKLLERFKDRLPGGAIPAEGYLLEISSSGILIVAGEPVGEIRARQTLRQVKAERGFLPGLRIADWPTQA
jgi:hypothetical protein